MPPSLLPRTDTTNDTVCPPTIPFCNPSIGPGPAMVADQSANALITDGLYPSSHNMPTGSEIEVNNLGIVLIIAMVFVLFGLWVWLAKWPRTKIKGWWKARVVKKQEAARQKELDAAIQAEMDLAAGVPSTASAVDLTPADIESAVNMINTRVAKELRTALPPVMEKNVSSASTVVNSEASTREKKTFKVLEPDSEEPQANTDVSVPTTPKTPPRAVVRESSIPILPIIPTGSPFASMRSVRSFLTMGRKQTQ